MQENHERMLYILNIILKAEPHLQHETFLTKLSETKKFFHDETKEKEYELDFQKFLDFLETKAPQKVQALPIPSLKVKRLYVDGCFDLMHSGHFNAIRQAKALCETLVVGVISNEAIVENKGPYIMSLQERVELVRACKWVDEIVEGVEYNPSLELIDKINCSHVGHGDDIAKDATGQDSYHAIRKAGRIKTFKRTEGISTTDIVGRLLLMTKSHHFESSLEETKKLRKMSGEEGIAVANLKAEVLLEKTKPTEYESQLPKVKLLNTTRRIREFSSGKDIKPHDKVVYIDGSFDILHDGHIKTLQKAKELGTFLLVGIHDDELINEHKGSNFPILNLQERVLNILALKYVDDVIMGAPWKITENMIKNFNISLVVEGSMGKSKNDNTKYSDDPYEIPKKMGIYQTIHSENNMSIETIIQRIIVNREKYIENQKKKEQKLQNYYNTEDFTVKEVILGEEKKQG